MTALQRWLEDLLDGLSDTEFHYFLGDTSRWD